MKLQYVYFEGPDKNVALIYKLKKNKNNKTNSDSIKNTTFVPIKKITTNTNVLLPIGEYLIANECSSYLFQVKEDKPIYIKLSSFNITFLNSTEQNNVDVVCENKVTGHKKKYTDRNEFNIFPGKNIIMVAGKKFLFESLENETKKFIVQLQPLILHSVIEDDQTQYFIRSVTAQSENNQNTSQYDQNQNDILSSTQVDQVAWLNPGEYELEVNGTKSKVNIQKDESTIVNLGALKIAQPDKFPSEERIAMAGQPIFAYLNKKIIFSLDKTYSIFPKRYLINLDNSEIEQEVVVNEEKLTQIQTFGAKIQSPPCDTNKSQTCLFSQKVLLHMNQQGYVLAKIPLNTPFVVFENEYQYSIEGADGILKKLDISSNSIKVDQIGRLKIHWKLQPSENNLETRKIYLDPTCCQLYGKSNDINSYRPREILLPIGDYRLDHFIKTDKNSLQKQTIPFHIGANTKSEIIVPIYSQQKTNNFLNFNEDDKETTDGSVTLTPILP